MPCNSDYQEPTAQEAHRSHTAKLYLYALTVLRHREAPTAQLKRDAEALYPVNDYTPQLCQFLRDLPEHERDALVYNGRSAMSRKLADWWEVHQKADAKREEAERKAQMRKDLRERLKTSLSPQEFDLIFFKD